MESTAVGREAVVSGQEPDWSRCTHTLEVEHAQEVRTIHKASGSSTTSSSQAPPLKDSMIFQNSTTRWIPSVQTLAYGGYFTTNPFLIKMDSKALHQNALFPLLSPSSLTVYAYNPRGNVFPITLTEREATVDPATAQVAFYGEEVNQRHILGSAQGHTHSNDL